MNFPLALFSTRRSALLTHKHFMALDKKPRKPRNVVSLVKLVVCAAVFLAVGALLIKVASVGAATNGVDPSFNPGGSGAAYNPVGLVPGFTGDDRGIRAMVVQPDGKIIIGGNIHDYNGKAAPNGIMRLNPDGTLDNTFNAGGSGIDAIYAGFLNAFGNFVRGDGGVRALALQSDGKIVVGLDAQCFNYNLQGGPPDNLTQITNITRLNPDGSWDSTFNPVLPKSPAFPRNNGGLSSDGLSEARVNAIAVLPDDKILVGGRFESYNRSNRQDIDVPDGLIRLNADGSWDPSFNQGGAGFSPASDSILSSAEIHALAVQPDGRILVGGDFGVYKTAATLTPPGPGLPLPQRSAKARGIIRLLSNGQADVFPDDLGPNIPFPLAVPVRSIALQPDGKILIGGDFTKWGPLDEPHKVMRLKADGSPDNTFNAGGAGANDSVYSIALQPDGRVLIGGQFTNYNGTDVPDHLIRLKTDGTRDTTLNPSGTGVDGDVFALALQPNGRILIGGQFANYNGADVPDKIMRLLPTNGVIAFASANYSVGESGGNAVIVLQRTAGADTEVVANVTATNGTASSADYSFPPGGVSVTWPAGDSADKVILIPIVSDGVAEPNETLTLNLSLISGGAFLDTLTATLTIQDASDPNNAPVNRVPGPQATNEDVPLVLSLANGNQFSISDPDAGTKPVQVTLRGIPGFLTLNGISGLTFPGGAFGDGTDDALMRFTGSIPDINAALNGMSFKPVAGFHGSAGLQISTEDQGNSGPGGNLIKVDLVVITVNSVADTPSVTPAATTVGVQTTSGLVISRNPSDGAEITHFKITNIKGGALFKHNGTTPINNNDFITFAEGNAGLRFTPDTKAGGSFNVQSSFDNTDAGVGSGFATAAITINCLPAIVVINSDDDGAGSLRQTIRDACNGSTITFDMSPGKVTSPITLTSGMLLIDGDMAVIGPGANLLAVMRSTAAGTGKFTVLGNAADNVVISGLTISNGDTVTTGFLGSGIVQARGTLTLTGVTVSGNAGGIGVLGVVAGGIYIGSGTVLNLNNSTVSGNSSEGGGGGIGNYGTLNANKSSITGNTAVFAPNSFGGGILNRGGGNATLVNCTVSGNDAPSGGGIYNQGKLFSLNSTISGNTTVDLNGEGGGIENVFTNSQLTLINNTVSANNSAGTTGGIHRTAGTVSLKNTIVAANTDAAGSPDLGGNFTSQDYNLIGNPTGATFTGTTTHHITNVSALLGPLVNNGGPTKIHPLLLGSPAINAGDDCVFQGTCADFSFFPVLTDQRGFGRSFGTATDIGAVESNYFIEATDGTPQAATINTLFGTQLRATVKESGIFQSNLSLTFTAPGSGPSGTFNTTGTNTATAMTNAFGVAIAPLFTANSTAGGPYNIIASVTGIDGTASFALTNIGLSQTINFGGLSNKTFGDPDFLVGATATSGLSISFTAAGNCTVSGNSVHLTGAGSCTITASQGGNSTYAPSPNVPQTFNIAKAASTTIVTCPVSVTYAGSALTPCSSSVTGAGGLNQALTVNYTNNTNVGTGNASASFAGDADHTANNDSKNFSINKATPVVTFGAAPTPTYLGGNFTVTASTTNTDSAALTYSVVSGPCALVSGATFSSSGAGTCVVKADGAATTNFNAASNTQNVTIGKATPTVTFGAAPTPTYLGGNFTVSASTTNTDSAALTFSVVSGPCALVSGATFSSSGIGTCVVKVDGAATTNFNAASSTQNVTIAKSNQTITFGALGSKDLGDPDFTVSATASSGLNVSFTAGGQCTINTNTVHLTALGSCTITAQQAGDANYNAAPDVPQTFSINPATGFIGFSAVNHNGSESTGFVTVTINRSGKTSTAVAVDYATSDPGAPLNCSVVNSGLASSRCDFTAMFGTLNFAANETQKTLDIPINQDSFTEGPEVFTINLSNPTGGAVLVTPSSATITISDSTAPAPNTIDDVAAFVRQLYHDFLNREPDAVGLAFWVDNINKCNDPARRPAGQTAAQCIDLERNNTAAAFFLSIEFMQTGGLVRNFYVSALNRPLSNNMPGLVEFTRDTQGVQRGVVVGLGNWQQLLDANRQAFMTDFVMRAEFVGLYPTTDTPTQYVDKLFQHANVAPVTVQERLDIILEFGGALTAADPAARGRALLRITQNPTFRSREFIRAFVHLQYLGYLRRDPNAAPDTNFDGYNFWLSKLTAFDGNYIAAEMTKSFMNSAEYRRRFGP